MTPAMAASIALLMGAVLRVEVSESGIGDVRGSSIGLKEFKMQGAAFWLDFRHTLPGTSRLRVTTAPAPTTAPSQIRTGSIVAPVPIETPFLPTVVERHTNWSDRLSPARH